MGSTVAGIGATAWRAGTDDRSCAALGAPRLGSQQARWGGTDRRIEFGDSGGARANRACGGDGFHRVDSRVNRPLVESENWPEIASAKSVAAVARRKGRLPSS